MMEFTNIVDLAQKLVAIALGIFALYTGIISRIVAKKDKIKRNASDDVPK